MLNFYGLQSFQKLKFTWFVDTLHEISQNTDSLARIFSCKDWIEDTVLTWNDTCQRKLVFWHILCSGRYSWIYKINGIYDSYDVNAIYDYWCKQTSSQDYASFHTALRHQRTYRFCNIFKGYKWSIGLKWVNKSRQNKNRLYHRNNFINTRITLQTKPYVFLKCKVKENFK